MGAERDRVAEFGKLENGLRQAGDRYRWGPYVSERQWGTGREDYWGCWRWLCRQAAISGGFWQVTEQNRRWPRRRIDESVRAALAGADADAVGVVLGELVTQGQGRGGKQGIAGGRVPARSRRGGRRCR